MSIPRCGCQAGTKNRGLQVFLQADGTTLLDGLDVAEVGGDGRLRRVLGFHDPLPPLG